MKQAKRIQQRIDLAIEKIELTIDAVHDRRPGLAREQIRAAIVFLGGTPCVAANARWAREKG